MANSSDQIYKLIHLDCQDPLKLTTRTIDDPFFDQILYSGELFVTILKLVFQNQKISSPVLEQYTETVENSESTSEKLIALENCLTEIEIEFEFDDDQEHSVDFEDFPESDLKDHLMNVLTQLEHNYLDAILEERKPPTQKSEVMIKSRLSLPIGQEMELSNTSSKFEQILLKYSQSTPKNAKPCSLTGQAVKKGQANSLTALIPNGKDTDSPNGAPQPPTKPKMKFLEATIGNLPLVKKEEIKYEFKPTQNSEEIMKYFVCVISKCLGMNSKQSGVFLIKDGEYFAKLLIRGHKNNDSEQQNVCSIYSTIRSDFKKQLMIAIEHSNEKQILITLLQRLAYGFSSKYQIIYENCIQFFQDIFQQINLFCKKSSVDTDGNNSEVPAFFQPKFVKEASTLNSNDFTEPIKSTNFDYPTIAENTIPSKNINQDIPLDQWYMHGSFLEQLFRGLERNIVHLPDCLNIILIPGKSNSNEILHKLCRTGDALAKDNLQLLNRIFSQIVSNEISILEIVKESFDYYIGTLLTNINHNIKRNSSLQFLLCTLSHKNLQLEEIKITKSQTDNLIHILISNFGRPYDASIQSIIVQSIRFLSKIMHDNDFMSQEEKIGNSGNDPSPVSNNSATILQKAMASTRIVPVSEGFLTNLDFILTSFLGSTVLMSNRDFRNILWDNCQPSMCYIKLAEHVILNYKKQLEMHKDKMYKFVNVSDYNFFYKWCINTDKLNDNTYFALFYVQNEFLNIRHWLSSSRNILLYLIKEKDIDNNFKIFDHLLKNLKRYTTELSDYQKQYMTPKIIKKQTKKMIVEMERETQKNMNQSDCRKHKRMSMSETTQPLDIEYNETSQHFERTIVQISIVNNLLKRIHDTECLNLFLSFLAKLLEYSESDIVKDFIDKILLNLDERYSLNQFKTRIKEWRGEGQGLQSHISEIDYDTSKSNIKSDDINTKNKTDNSIGPDGKNMLLTVNDPNGDIINQTNTQSINNTSTDDKSENLNNNKKKFIYDKVIRHTKKSKEAETKQKQGIIDKENSLNEELQNTQNDITYASKSFRDFDYTRFFENPFSKKTQYTHWNVKAFQKIEKCPTPDTLKTIVEFDKMKLYQIGQSRQLIQQYDVTSVNILEQKSIKYFFRKYNKLFKELFRKYSGRFRSKKIDVNNAEDIATYKNLQHHSEFWGLMRDLAYSDRLNPTKVSIILKELKMQNKTFVKGQLYINFEEFKAIIINLLIMDSIESLKQDAPLKYLQDVFVKKVDEKLSKKLSKHLFDNANMLIIPSDPIIIYHQESQANKMMINHKDDLDALNKFQLPKMYEFYIEKNIIYKQSFNRNLFLKYCRPTYIMCYELLTEFFIDKLKQPMHDFAPTNEYKIRIRISKSWLEPFSSTSNEKVYLAEGNVDLKNNNKKLGNLLNYINKKMAKNCRQYEVMDLDKMIKDEEEANQMIKDEEIKKIRNARRHASIQKNTIPVQLESEMLKEDDPKKIVLKIPPTSATKMNLVHNTNSEDNFTINSDNDDTQKSDIKEKPKKSLFRKIEDNDDDTEINQETDNTEINQEKNKNDISDLSEDPLEKQDTLKDPKNNEYEKAILGATLQKTFVDNPIIEDLNNEDSRMDILDISNFNDTKKQVELQQLGQIGKHSQKSILSIDSPNKASPKKRIVDSLEFDLDDSGNKKRKVSETINDLNPETIGTKTRKNEKENLEKDDLAKKETTQMYTSQLSYFSQFTPKAKIMQTRLYDRAHEKFLNAGKAVESDENATKYHYDNSCIKNFKWSKILGLSQNSRLVLSDLEWNEYYLGAEVATSFSEIISFVDKVVIQNPDQPLDPAEFTLSNRKITNTFLVQKQNDQREKSAVRQLKDENIKKRHTEVNILMKNDETVQIKLNALRVNRSLELKKSLVKKDRINSLTPKITIRDDHYKEVKELAKDYRNKLILKNKKETQEKISKAREDLESKKEKAKQFQKDQVSDMEKKFIQTIKKKKDKHAEIKLKEEATNPEKIKEMNQNNWDKKLKKNYNQMIDGQKNSDENFHIVIDYLLSNLYYMEKWEKLFIIVFEKYVHFNFYSIDNIRNTSTTQYKQILEEEQKENYLISEKSKVSPSLPRKEAENKKKDGTADQNSKSIFHIHKNYTKQPKFQKELQEKQQKMSNSWGLVPINKYSHLNYTVVDKNDFSGFNECVEHPIVLKLLKDAEIIPQILKNENVLKQMKRLSRFCEHFKSFNKEEFLNLVRWLCFEISLEPKYQKYINEKIDQFNIKLQEVKKQSSDSELGKPNPKSKHTISDIVPSVNSIEKLESGEESEKTIKEVQLSQLTPITPVTEKQKRASIQQIKTKYIRKNSDLSIIEDSLNEYVLSEKKQVIKNHLDSVSDEDEDEDNSSDVDKNTARKKQKTLTQILNPGETNFLKKKDASVLDESLDQTTEDYKYYGTKIAKEKYDRRFRFSKGYLRKSIKEPADKVFKGMVKKDLGVFVNIKDSFDDKNLNIKKFDENTQNLIRNYLKVIQYMRIQFTHAYMTIKN